MNHDIRSPFQMKAYRTRCFSFSVPLTASQTKDEIHHQFSGSYLIDRRNDKWCGLLIMSYAAGNDAPGDDERFSLEVTMDSVFESAGDDSEAGKKQFAKTLQINGAVALLSIMRGQVAAATTSLGLSPGVIVPSINLNKFEWADLSDKGDAEAF